MANQHSTEVPAQAPRSLVGRVRALVLGGPLWRKLAIGGGVVAVIGGTVWFSLGGKKESPAATKLALRDAMHWLEAGDYAEAKNVVAELKEKHQLSYDDRGAVAYVHGLIAMKEAETLPQPDDQRKRYLVAARFLDAAHHDGFPALTTADGQRQLGECWHHAGRYARALPFLKQALSQRPRNPAEIHRLLADAYYRDTPSQPKLALEHLEKYLASRALTPQQRDSGLIEKARIQIDRGYNAAATATLASIDKKSELRSLVQLMEARMVMQEALDLTVAAKSDTAQAAKARERWQAAADLLRAPLKRDEETARAQRESQYLLGICYLRLEDKRAAENQFSRSRRINLGLPEGIASAIEEAELKRLAGDDAGALELYGELLRDLGDVHDYSNPWLSLEALRERCLAGYRYYRDADKFSLALQFIELLAPLVDKPRRMELQAEVERRWADQLLAKAAKEEGAAAAALEQQAYAHFRASAEAYYKLARTNPGTKAYPDRLWASATAYQLAHDYHRSTRVMRLYLDENQPDRQADALLAIAEAELALNNLEASQAAIAQMTRDLPRHPLTYRGRLVLHQVWLEKNKYAAAQRVLLENLEHESLTPQSLEWRDSLFALADTYYHQGIEFEATSRKEGVDGDDAEQRKKGLKALEQAAAALHQAITRYQEALARYPDAPQAIEARYLAAESYRQAAKFPRKLLPVTTIETTRAALFRQQREELTEAQKLYAGLITDLNELQDQHPLPARQRDILRNCYFLYADALFDGGQFQEAILAYSSATNRYQQRPEALEAFVQIASCYRQLAEPAKARGTLEQAKVVLRRMPADSKFDATTRFNRDEWVVLLDFLSTL